MNFKEMYLKDITRRHFFEQAFGQALGFGIGSAALASLMSEEAAAQGVLKQLHHTPKAKNIIYLQMAGGASHVDLFDYKPTLIQRHDEPIPDSVIKGEKFFLIKGDQKPRLQQPLFEFKQRGQSGAWISNIMPHLAGIADDISFVKSMHNTQINHGPAQIWQMTGFQIPVRPSFGAWISYGIGSENKDLPTYVVMLSGDSIPDGGGACWGCGFLPTVHQGVQFQQKGDPVFFVSNPEGTKPETRRGSIDLINGLNTARYEAVGDPEIVTQIAQYEMAYRMQSSVPDLTDIASEPASTHEMYGTTPGQASFANNALLARRLVERGVRFVQLSHRYWDMHGSSYNEDIINKMPVACRETDRAVSALVRDLKQRGLLDETLVVWATEFGRTPMKQNTANSVLIGRDHHPRGYTIWMAGGGIKPGLSYGGTDEFGYWAVDKPATVHDLHATLMHLLGVDHTRLTYQYQGRPFRLTDTEGSVLKELLL